MIVEHSKNIAALDTSFDTLIVDVNDDKSLSAETNEIRELFETLDSINPEEAAFGAHAHGFSYFGRKFSRLAFVRRPKGISPGKIRQRYGRAAKVAEKLKSEKALYIPFEKAPKKDFVIISEGWALGRYKFEKYKKMKTPGADLTILFPDDINAELAEGKLLADAAYFARDLATEPANVATPEEVARRVKELESIAGIKVEALGLAEIKKLRLGAFLAVAKGSAREPKLVAAEYNGAAQNAKRVALIGKGVCFDSGGYCLKGAEYMATMKTDMSGAAAAFGAVSAIARAKLPVNVVAISALCENMISGSAAAPGDVVEARNGTLIEIVNTDAEGRLTLADALVYAIEEKKADYLVDIATLTGSVASALGNAYSGAFCGDEKLFRLLEESSFESGENIWRLPLAEEYKSHNRSEIAHIKNLGAKTAGAISAALFLQEFTLGRPWIHLDIAGTARNDKETDLNPVGPTGTGTSLLYWLAKKLAE